MTNAERLIERVQREIESCALNDLRVEKLADAVAISRWQLQRCFLALIGSSIGDYLRAYRLSRAAEALVETERRIIDIALDTGFESQEAFSRAFKVHFKTTPKQYRQFGALRNITLKLVVSTIPTWRKVMKLEIVSKPEIHMIGVQDHFNGVGSDNANNFEVIPPLWEKINAIVATVGHAPERMLGYMGVSDQPQKGELTYLAGYEVTADRLQALDPGLTGVTIPAQQYAILQHRGQLKDLPKTLDFFYAQWLPESGYKLGEGCGIEVYDDRFNATSEDSYFETWIPVLKA